MDFMLLIHEKCPITFISSVHPALRRVLLFFVHYCYNSISQPVSIRPCASGFVLLPVSGTIICNWKVKGLLKIQRQKNLLELLSSHDVMTISDLSKKLNSSMMTIRRDLEYLEQKGIVRRMHGGALLLRQETAQPSFRERIEEFDDEKHRIGKAAAGMIREGNIVFFDAGTTPLAVVEHIPPDLEFTAVTTGLMTAVALCNKPRANVINVGGNIHATSYSATNYLAIEFIKRFHADIAFISTKAISIPEGTFEAQLPLIEVKKAIVSVSNQVVLLADHSKFESKSLCLSVPLQDIHTFITDDGIPESTIEALKKAGREVFVV